MLLLKMLAGVIVGYILMEVCIRVGDLIAKFWNDDTWGDFR